MQIQNQHGNRPKRWYTTGVVTEVLPNRQYTVVKDGSRRITHRNRRFLRKISPLCRNTPDVRLEDSIVRPSDVPATVVDGVDRMSETEHRTPLDLPTEAIPIPSTEIEPSPPAVPPLEVRRGTRERKPRELFTAKMKGKYHE